MPNSHWVCTILHALQFAYQTLDSEPTEVDVRLYGNQVAMEVRDRRAFPPAEPRRSLFLRVLP